MIAARREAEEKSGDHYKGHWIIRAKSIFNSEGQRAEGGICMVDEYGDRIPLEHAPGLIKSGCIGLLLVRGNPYTMVNQVTGKTMLGMGLFLHGFQYAEEGEEIFGGHVGGDYASLFDTLPGAKKRQWGGTNPGAARTDIDEALEKKEQKDIADL